MQKKIIQNIFPNPPQISPLTDDLVYIKNDRVEFRNYTLDYGNYQHEISLVFVNNKFTCKLNKSFNVSKSKMNEDLEYVKSLI